MSLVDYQSSSEGSEDDEPVFKTQPPSNAEQTAKGPIKKREPVKITIPSLTEAEDENEDESSRKKLKVNNAANLLGLLPPPKYSIGKGGALTPHVLTKKKEQNENVKVLKAPSVVTHHSYERTSGKPAINSIQEPDPPTKCDFFSLQTLDRIEDVPLPGETPIMFKSLPTPVSSTFYDLSDIPIPSSKAPSVNSDSLPSNSEACPSSSYSNDESYSQVIDNNQGSAQVSYEGNTDDRAAIPQEPEDIMNDERFRRLYGKRGKGEDLNIIDVNVEQQLPDKIEWHTKSITEEKNLHSRQKHHMPTPQQKRKHQITYLAFQAKERELDLKNQWAQNRLTKRETQAKYGF